jgi:hypothetical protein
MDACAVMREAVRYAVEDQRPGMKFSLVLEDMPESRVFAVLAQVPVSGECVCQVFDAGMPATPREAFELAADGVREWLRMYDEQREKV